jgi:hypothetical protein
MEKVAIFTIGATATWFLATRNFKPMLSNLPYTGDVNFNLRQSPDYQPTFFYGPLNHFREKADYDMFADPVYVEKAAFEKMITTDKLINNPNYGPYNQMPGRTLNPVLTSEIY